MTPERWRQVKETLLACLDHAPEERADFLERVCASDADLRRQVEQLLAAEPAADALLEPSLFGGADGPPDFPAGHRLGAWRILRELGRGGMGVVYLAARDDDQFRKEVALKVIKRGMDTDFVLRRFQHERRILAQLDHPNIARFLDGGTTPDGRPYFLMEYVGGEAIDAWCDARALSLDDRLRLFHTVCTAVQHAHQNLVIHRDLKPGNIVVTADGTPKLLDFGLAKLLDPAHAPHAPTTAVALQAMTPEYASPEQVRGEPLTTATDVYSLGVLLYELLTGGRPYRFPSRRPDEIARTICEVEPERPGARVPRLRGDLENIILMALAKDPARRYASVEQLGDDVRRYLEGLPIRARRATWDYRAGKFVRRNRAAVAAVALVLASLVGGIGATAWQARVAQAERVRAERRFEDVRALARSFLFEFHDGLEALPGSIPLRELVVRRAIEYLDRLSREVTADDVSLLRELATAYERVGRIQGNSYYSNLGNTAGAVASYGKALEIRERLAAAHPADAAIQNELAASYVGMGDMEYTVNYLKAGLGYYERALAIRDALISRDPENPASRRALHLVHTRLGDIKGMDGYMNLGDTEGAVVHYQRALELAQEDAAADSGDRPARVALAYVQAHLGILRRTTGDLRAAIRNGREAVAILEGLAASDPDGMSYRMELLAAYASLRFALVDDGLFTEAIANTRRAVAILEDMVRLDARNAQARRNLAVSYNALGRDLLRTGDAAGAMVQIRKALALTQALAAADPESGEHNRDLAYALHGLGEAQAAAGSPGEALGTFRRALSLREALLSTNPDSPRNRDDVAASQAEAGKLLAALGDAAGALEALRRAVTLAEEALLQSPADIGMRARLATRYYELGQVEAGSTARCEAYRRSLEVWQELDRNGTLPQAEAGKREAAARAVLRCAALAEDPGP